MSDCRCFSPPLDYRDYEKTFVGIDMTNGRCGEVTLEICKHCATKWLHYFVEYEAFTGSGRWFRGPISDSAAATIIPDSAIAYLEQLPWHFVGGSYYQSTGMRTSGAIRADL